MTYDEVAALSPLELRARLGFLTGGYTIERIGVCGDVDAVEPVEVFHLHRGAAFVQAFWAAQGQSVPLDKFGRYMALVECDPSESKYLRDELTRRGWQVAVVNPLPEECPESREIDYYVPGDVGRYGAFVGRYEVWHEDECRAVAEAALMALTSEEGTCETPER